MGRVFGFSGLFLFVFSQLASAYTPTVMPSGNPVRWKGRPRLALAGNPRNQSGLSDADVFGAVTRSLNRWKAASGGSVDFGYWQGTDSRTYVPGSLYDGLSTIYFASNAQADPHLASNVLGLTQVWYDTKTGQILEADVVLNDRDFRLTTNPRDTSGYGSGGTSFSGGRSNVYIENVITHELGHAFGLSHSGGLQSTMLFMESPEQAHLGCDESVAIRALYPSGDAGQRGSVSGRVVEESGAALFGAQVLAISRRRGTVLASALTDRSGRYTIGALEPGEYYLVVEPFFAGGQTLPAFYSDLRYSVCQGGRAFGRTALTDGSGFRLLPLEISAGAGVEAPVLVAVCAPDGGAAIYPVPGATSAGTAPELYNGARGPGGFGVVDRSGYSQTSYYKLGALSGSVEIHALSYSLYSPVRQSLALLDAGGRDVHARVSEQVYAGDSGFTNFDGQLGADGLPPGDYFVRVSTSYVDQSYYPAGSVSLDGVPFILLTASVNEGPLATGVDLPANPRCRMQENFAPYSSPPGEPPRFTTREEEGTGFCATVQRAGEPPASGSGRRGGHPPGAAAIAGWFAPFALIGVFARRLRRLGRNSRLRRLPNIS